MPFSNVMSLNLGIGLGSAISIPNPDPPVVNYVARTDGVSQYWELSEPVQVLQNYTVRYKFLYASGLSNVAFIHANSQQSSGLQAYVVVSTNEIVFTGNASTKLNGVDFQPGTQIQTDTEYQVEFQPSSNRDIDSLFKYQDTEKYTEGYMYDLEVLNEFGDVVNKIPLTNKEQGATQIATVGTINATMINYTEDVWEVDDNAS